MQNKYVICVLAAGDISQPPSAYYIHPNLKLKYFQTHRWEQDWIDTAEALVREEYKKYEGPLVSDAGLVCFFYDVASSRTCCSPYCSSSLNLPLIQKTSQTSSTSHWRVLMNRVR
ncbi:hypothetical protein L208DRAFT_1291213 [Tricholoma matsutake]|nr:hypothetical protein L208DRAFT_1291213 [Tricholoma matsutake 945]